MSERPNDPGLTSGDPLAPGPEAPRHESGLPGLRAGSVRSPRPAASRAATRPRRRPARSARPPARRPSRGRYALAGWWSRVGAALIDGIIIGVGALADPGACSASVFSVGFFASDEAGIVGARSSG